MIKPEEEKKITDDVIKLLDKLGIDNEKSLKFINENKNITQYDLLKSRRYKFFSKIVKGTTNKGAWRGISYSGNYMDTVDVGISDYHTFYDSQENKIYPYVTLRTVLHFFDDRYDVIYIDKNIIIDIHVSNDKYSGFKNVCNIKLDKCMFIYNSDDMINVCKYIKNFIDKKKIIITDDEIMSDLNNDY